MSRRLAVAVAGGALLLAPAQAAAHGLVARADLPLPAWLFGWAAALVLVVSFAALAVLWPEPKLEEAGSRPLPDALGRALTSPVVELVCGLVGVALLGLVLWSGLAGANDSGENIAPTFVYVVFWVGLVVASVLFGDVFRLFNPWRAIGRAVSWVAGRLAPESLEPVPYPERLGRIPAVAGLLAFAWLELVEPDASLPRTVALAAIVYTALTLVAMVAYGVEPWMARGEAFSVYFGLFARISPWERRGRTLGLRPPLAGLTRLDPVPGTVLLITTIIAITTFDGLSEGAFWSDVGGWIADTVEDAGLSRSLAVQLANGIGLLACVLVVYGFYRLAVAGAAREGRVHDLAGAFVHSLVPIGLAYVLAHYATFLLYQGQAMLPLASDPLGRGWDLFGTADRRIDYGVIGANATWYLQVAVVVAGHIAGLILAHDRALRLFGATGRAVRSQLWTLAVMVGFTSLALWLLNQANA